jgi:hypothetical protein
MTSVKACGREEGREDAAARGKGDVTGDGTGWEMGDRREPTIKWLLLSDGKSAPKPSREEGKGLLDLSLQGKRSSPRTTRTVFALFALSLSIDIYRRTVFALSLS